MRVRGRVRVGVGLRVGVAVRPYSQVRAELRDKYKRHPWPDDPANAAPTKLTNRALSKLQAQVSLSLTLTPTLTF